MLCCSAHIIGHYAQNYAQEQDLCLVYYRITRFFRWELIFALFASDVESAKIVK